MNLKINKFYKSIFGDNLSGNSITTIYGPPAIGKSTLCFEFIIETLKLDKKVIYVDTEGGFSIERINQIDSSVNIKDIIVFSPKSFEEQFNVIKKLNEQIKNNKNIGLIIIDSLVMLYRLKLGGNPQKINADLGEQLRLLTEISRTYNIPILVTNQMYKNFDTNEKKMVGGDLINYWSKIIIEMDKEGHDKYLKLIKHKFIDPSNKKIFFRINNSGLEEIKKRSFKLF
jgi:DNA repair protein RadB